MYRPIPGSSLNFDVHWPQQVRPSGDPREAGQAGCFPKHYPRPVRPNGGDAARALPRGRLATRCRGGPQDLNLGGNHERGVDFVSIFGVSKGEPGSHPAGWLLIRSEDRLTCWVQVQWNACMRGKKKNAWATGTGGVMLHASRFCPREDFDSAIMRAENQAVGSAQKMGLFAGFRKLWACPEDINRLLGGVQVPKLARVVLPQSCKPITTTNNVHNAGIGVANAPHWSCGWGEATQVICCNRALAAATNK